MMKKKLSIIIIFLIPLILTAADIDIQTDEISIKFAKSEEAEIEKNEEIPEEIKKELENDLRDEWKKYEEDFEEKKEEIEIESPLVSSSEEKPGESAPVLNEVDAMRSLKKIVENKIKELKLLLRGKKVKTSNYPNTISLRPQDFSILKNTTFVKAINNLSMLDRSNGFKKNYHLMKNSKAMVRDGRYETKADEGYFYLYKNDIIYLYYLGYMHELIANYGYEPEKFYGIAREYYVKMLNLYIEAYE